MGKPEMRSRNADPAVLAPNSMVKKQPDIQPEPQKHGPAPSPTAPAPNLMLNIGGLSKMSQTETLQTKKTTNSFLINFIVI
jgi:hypothetical protein